MSLVSGGAKGSDVYWGIVASEHKHKVKHLSFQGHCISSENRYVIEDKDLLLADVYLKEASKYLKRGTGRNRYIKNLLRRNYYQIKDTQSVYAISSTFEKKNIRKLGGTAWACVMFMQKLKKEYGEGSLPQLLPLYIFSQSNNVWYQLTSLGSWKGIKKPPTPSGVYTGIGTRDLNDKGKKAIWSVYD